MPFRVSGIDLLTGRPAQPYETRAATEAEARAEAARLSIRIESLVAIDPAIWSAADDDHPLLANWSSTRLKWHVERGTLLRLGIEHPRWGKWLYSALAVSAGLFKKKVLLNAFVAWLVTTFAAIGIKTEKGVVVLVLAPLVMLGPLLIIKAYVFVRLQRQHAHDGFGDEQRLRVTTDELHYFDGSREQKIPVQQIGKIHDLPHFVLIGLRDTREIAVPKAAFSSATLGRRFAIALAEAAGIKPALDFRSQWAGNPTSKSPSPPVSFISWIVVFLVSVTFLIIALLLIARIAR